MSRTKKVSLFLIATTIVVTVFVYYRYSQNAFLSSKQDEVIVKPGMAGTPSAPVTPEFRDVNAVVKYEVPNDKFDTLRFVVTVSKDGTIQKIQTFDAATGEAPEKKKEFTEQINVILKGKKLSDLEAIDKVGTSSLTTTAFNSALGDLKKAL